MQGNYFGLSAGAIVCDTDGSILMVKREDLRVWTLPGGGVDYGETIEATACREVFEETGIHAVLDHLQGIYFAKLANRSYLAFVYVAHPSGGEITTSFESIEVSYFPADGLPSRVPRHIRRRIEHLADGNHKRLFVDEVPLRLQIFLRVFFKIRNWRNRHILRHPPSTQTRFMVYVQAWVNNQVIAQITASPKEAPWLTLQKVIQRETSQSLSPKQIRDMVFNIEDHTITLLIEFA